MKRLLTLFFGLMVFLLPACSPSAPRQAKTLPIQQVAAVQPTRAMAAAPTPTPALYEAAATLPPGATPPSGNAANTSPLAFEPAGSKMVIKDAQMELLVQDSSQALNRVTGLVGDEGGYIISSQTWYQDGYLYATLRLGIPSARFEAALNELRRIGLTVLKENAQGQDVTDQYIDLQSRLTNLEATAARVREFLKDAKTIEESLRVNQQLAELEAQIEQVKGQMGYFEGRTAYSTVTVSLTPQYPTPTPTATFTPMPTHTSTPPWNPGDTFDDASTVLTKEYQGAVDAIIWTGVILGPWLLLILLVFIIFRGAIRKGMPKT